ncbi:pentapeptide repeat-containing protein [Rhodococcus hoagii]|nr:pentapeptide repeat-containing protein [Prescottella equi]
MQIKRGQVVGGVGIAATAMGGYLAGRAFAIPGSSEFWDIAAQPVATAFAGIGAIAAGALAFANGHRTRLQDARHHAESSERDREAGLRVRYTESAKQLADENPAIREAGVYAVAALADDWHRFGARTSQRELGDSEQQVCVNLLCSYLRANRHQDAAEARSEQAERQEGAVRSTVVSVLRLRLNRWREQGVATLDLAGADLRGENLEGLDFSKANLTKADLSNANLLSADLSGALLSNANLFDATLIAANLCGASMHGVRGCRASFSAAQMRAAYIVEANLEDAELIRVDLTAAHVIRSNLSHANLFEANLDQCNLWGVDLTKTGVTPAQLDSANWADLDTTTIVEPNDGIL